MINLYRFILFTRDKQVDIHHSTSQSLTALTRFILLAMHMRMLQVVYVLTQSMQSRSRPGPLYIPYRDAFHQTLSSCNDVVYSISLVLIFMLGDNVNAY